MIGIGKIRSLWLLWTVLIGVASSAWARTPAAPTNPKKIPVRPHSIAIRTNVQGATVLEDGLFKASEGQAFDAALGVHELVVSAPGHVPRLVVVQVSDAQPSRTVAVRLLATSDRSDVELDFVQAARFEVKSDFMSLASLCEEFNQASSSMRPLPLLLPCKRRTLQDDFVVFGTRTFFGDLSKGETGPDASLRQTLVGRIESAATDEFYWALEDFYARAPEDQTASSLLAFSAMRRKNCGRVMQITMESQAAGFDNPGLHMVRGLCLELAGRAKKAVAFYQRASKAKAAGIDALYFVGRSWQSDSAAAEQALSRCVKAWPNFYPCFQALAHVHVLGGKPAAAKDVLLTYQKETAAALQSVIPLKKPLRLDPQKLAAAFDLRPLSLELMYAKALSQPSPELVTRLVAGESGAILSDVRYIAAMLPAFEQKADMPLLTAALRSVLADSPKDHRLWFKLAMTLSKSGECEEALAAMKNAIALDKNEKRRGVMRFNMSGCLIRLERFQEAETILTAFLAKNPSDWQAHFNLAIAQMELGKNAEALVQIEAAMKGEMDADLRAQAQKLLERIKGKTP